MSTTDEALVRILLGLMTHEEFDSLRDDIAARTAAASDQLPLPSEGITS